MLIASSSPTKERAARIKELDKLVGDYIKNLAGWCCEMCGKRYVPWDARGLTSAHVKTKGRYSLIRFEPDNLMALCWLPCHESRWHKDPQDAMRWFTNEWPGRIERIEIAARNAPKPDLLLLLQIWRKEVAELGSKRAVGVKD
jgi:hypothetical protein